MMALAPVAIPRASPTDRRGVSGRGRAANAGGVAARLRPAGAGPRDQRGDDPAVEPARREVVTPPGSGCCGSLVHHLGQEAEALAFARADIDAWERERLAGGLDAIAINASGCGTTVKDYGFMLREDPA